MHGRGSGGCSGVTDTEARDELRELVRRHAGSLDSEDLRALADDLEQTADKWEAL